MSQEPRTSETPASRVTVSPPRPSTEPPSGSSTLNRREFLKVLGAGLLISVTGEVVGEGRRRRGGRSRPVSARVHLARDGKITVMTGKVEVGQGGRAEISQAAAEELRVPVERVHLIMGDTRLCPDDGITAGSRTTPSTIPAVRRGCATAREFLIDLACRRWEVDRADVSVKEGAISDESGERKITYSELAGAEDLASVFDETVDDDVSLTPVENWRVMGSSVPRPNRRDLVTGAHRYPSDTRRPDMLRGKVLRPPSYGARLVSIDLSKAEALEDVVVARDGDFVGCAAPTTFQAEKALEALAAAAKWEPSPHPSSEELFEYLREHARGGRRSGRRSRDAGADAAGEGRLAATYTTAYIQHAPLEPRAAVAEWRDGEVTVWTGSQAPNRVHSEVARAFGIPGDRVRVIIPDTGGGFGGKHSGEYAVEAARLARVARRPVSLQWTREEEFTWAYFRPAALIDIEAAVDPSGRITEWDFTNINSGGAALSTPYDIPGARTEYVRCDAPLRHGSYRTLAATANNFARECFMDELAQAAGSDPLTFRLAHLKEPRLRGVLEAAAKRFGWSGRASRKEANRGVGLACGTEKGSFVAACAEVAVDRESGKIEVRHVCEVFECGKVINPANLLSQVQGCIIMGLGGALSEEVRFENGQILTNRFSRYDVPRFRNVPPLDIELLDRPDLPSVGGGETPIIAIAPAIGNAVCRATGVRLRSMPMRFPAGQSG